LYPRFFPRISRSFALFRHARALSLHLFSTSYALCIFLNFSAEAGPLKERVKNAARVGYSGSITQRLDDAILLP
jgi:hypothetical protein